jgi:hypothetical protein
MTKIRKYHLVATTLLGLWLLPLVAFAPGGGGSALQAYASVAALQKDVVQLAPGSQTFLEILWGGSWLTGTAGGATYYVRTLPPELASAYLRTLTDKGPPRPL